MPFYALDSPIIWPGNGVTFLLPSADPGRDPDFVDLRDAADVDLSGAISPGCRELLDRVERADPGLREAADPGLGEIPADPGLGEIADPGREFAEPGLGVTADPGLCDVPVG